MLNVVWFKRDLRVSDHRPLREAVEAGMVAPLYIIEPDFWAQPTASARQWRFVARTLAALRTQLAVLGAPLIVRVGDAVEVLESFRANTQELVLWSHEETGDLFSRERDHRVAEWAEANGIPWHQTPQPGIIRGSPSREAWSATWTAETGTKPLPPPEAMIAHGYTPGKIVSERILYLDDDPCNDLAAGPTVARRLLKCYLETGTENGQDGPAPRHPTVDGEPRLSAHVSWGTLSLREIRQALEVEFGGRTAVPVDRLLQRMRFRTDLIQRLEDQPTLQVRAMHAAFSAVECSDSPVLAEAWCEGQTGLPIVDATMRALTQSGWVDLDLRLLAMSVAAHHLRLDWRDFGVRLARLLTNYEPGVHWNLCQMAAGVTGFADCEIADVHAAGPRLDPEGAFVREWVPELRRVPDAQVHTPWSMSAEQQTEANCIIGADYPASVVDFAVAGRDAARRLEAIRSTRGFEDEARKLRFRHTERGTAIGAAAS